MPVTTELLKDKSLVQFKVNSLTRLLVREGNITSDVATIVPTNTYLALRDAVNELLQIEFKIDKQTK